MLENNLHSFIFSALSSSVSVTVSLCLSSSHCSSFHLSTYLCRLSLFFSPGDCPYSLYIQKQHIPLRLHKVALLPPTPLCVNLFIHSFTILIPPSITFLSIDSSNYRLSFVHLYLCCCHIIFFSCFSLAVSSLFTGICLPLLPCHFPLFFTLILSLSLSSPSTSRILSFVSSISAPSFQSILSFLLLLLSSYTSLSLVSDFPVCPLFLCGLLRRGPGSAPYLGTESGGRTNIANAIWLCMRLWHVSASPCAYLYMHSVCHPLSVGHRCVEVINSLKEERVGLVGHTISGTKPLYILYISSGAGVRVLMPQFIIWLLCQA